MMIDIDGSMHEGGGQIVRTALALSTITGKPFHVTKIRAGRPTPGLKAQHLHCIKALKQLSDARSKGAELAATEFSFYPGKMKSRNIEIDIGTAGSITLLVQSLILPCLYSPGPIRLTIIGGTDVKWSPPIDYFANVFLPHIRKYAKKINVKVLKRGYHPKGGGKVDLLISPKENPEGKIDVGKRGELVNIKGVSHASTDLFDSRVAERQARAAKLALQNLQYPIEIRTEYQKTPSTGSGITLWVTSKDELDDDPVIIGADALGERGKKAEEVGKEAAMRLQKEIESKNACDQFLEDQLIPFVKKFGGELPKSESAHTKANEYVCGLFL